MVTLKSFAWLLCAAVANARVHESEYSSDQQLNKQYEGMKETLRSFAAAASKGEINTQTIMAVTQILDTINSTLLVALESDRNHTQHLLDTQWNAVHKCDDDRTNWFNSSYIDIDTNVSACHGQHDGCRQLESIEYDNMTEHFNTLRDRVCDWEFCGATPSFAAGHTEEVRNFMTCVIQFVDDHQPHYLGERERCIHATNIHAAKRVECHGVQHRCELEQCDRERDVQTQCTNYRNCRTNEETSWLRVRHEAQGIEDVMKSQRVALECLLCYGNQILTNSTDLDVCEQNAKPCEELSGCPLLTFDAIDPFTNCTEPTQPNIPCNNEYHDLYYLKFDGSNTTTDSCNLCHPLVPNLEGSLTSTPTNP